MKFDCWVTLYQEPEAWKQKPLRLVQVELIDTEPASGLQDLEPVVRDAAAKTGAIIIEMHPEMYRFSKTRKVPSVYFRIEADEDTAAEMLNLISESEDRPTVEARGVNNPDSDEDKFRRLLEG